MNALAVSIGFCAAEDALRERMGRSLESAGLTISHSCSDLADLVAVTDSGPFDIALIGVARPDGASLRELRALGQTAPTTAVVMVCERAGVGDVRKVLDAGIRGIVLAEQMEEVLLPVLRVVVAGQISVPAGRGEEAQEPILTMREKQILGLVVLGMTNAEIATKLFLAESTVKSHLSSAFAKLGVRSRNEATALILDPSSGLGMGILTIPTEKRQRRD